MKQAVKKVKVAKNVLASEIHAPTHSRKTDNVNAQKATVVQLDRTISLSRYLEACGDCV